MATTKPQITDQDIWAKTAAAVDKAKPAQAKVDSGWAFGEMPPFQIFNWFKNIYSQMFVHIQEYGIPEWSADIEYQKGGLTMHNEEVWRAAAINKNKQPGVASEWTKPFDIKLPIGSVVAYRGLVANIPAGWSIITDLNDRFIMGTSIVGDVGKMGGSSASSLPVHTHTASTNTAAAHAHTATHNHTASAANAASHTHAANHSHTASSASVAAHAHTANHNHSGSTGTNGSHAHTANHSHTASAASNGTHTHSYTDSTFRRQSGAHFGGSVQWGSSDIAKTTGSSGAHSHTVTVNLASFSTSNAGSHGHTVTINTKTFNTGSSGAHSHSITVNTTNFNTGSNGAHGHTITVNTKTFNTQNGGAHSHSVTVANAGVSGTTGNLPPYKKLMYIERIS